MRPVISIVIPTYNERENVRPLVTGIAKALSSMSYEVLFVDDGSPDGTKEEIERAARESSNVRVTSRKGKLGLGSAVLLGTSRALSDLIIVMDADLQHPPEVLPAIGEKLMLGCDLVVASRNIRPGGTKGWSVFRKFISWGAKELCYIVLPASKSTSDPLSGYFGFRRSILENVEFRPKGYKILVEILTRASYSAVCEVPYTFEGRKSGKSKLSPREYINFLLLLLDLRHSKPKRSTRPEW
jgi:dolichol-phosphate mannosyltransferase